MRGELDLYRYRDFRCKFIYELQQKRRNWERWQIVGSIRYEMPLTPAGNRLSDYPSPFEDLSGVTLRA